jgi:predicted metal-binding protein
MVGKDQHDTSNRMDAGMALEKSSAEHMFDHMNAEVNQGSTWAPFLSRTSNRMMQACSLVADCILDIAIASEEAIAHPLPDPAELQILHSWTIS